MSKSLKLIFIFFCCLGVSGPAIPVGATILVGDSGDLTEENGWTGSRPQRSTIENVNWLVDYYDGVIDGKSTLPYPLESFDKDEIRDGQVEWEHGRVGISGISYGSNGTWAALEGWEGPLYYSIETGGVGSGGFALYYTEGSTSGEWTTDDISAGKDLSPGRFWRAGVAGETDEQHSSPEPISEPLTMIVFGTVLACLAGLGNKRRKK